MLREIPTHLIGGPLGAGKTSLIRSLLAQKPAGERWAVLVNEFGEIGLDAALLATDVDGVAIGEVAGGCLCCVNGVPFQVGLGRLLRRARPDRLFIEPSGLGHPQALWKQLQAPPWSGVLALQPLVVVLDAAALASGQPLPEAQEQALEAAGMLLLNKSETLDATQRCAVRARLPVLPWRWSVRGHLALRDLPTSVAGEGSATTWAALPEAPAQLGTVLPAERPLRAVREQDGQFAIGWRLAPSVRFDRVAVDAWLNRLSGLRRAKAVLHCADGWYAANAAPFVDNWGKSSWRRDNRLELILAAGADEEALEEAFLACRMVAE
ncbi:TPA: cobalamin biosynthesis protein CobW [Pseudomonas aeruginosa]|nr:cobalamin biosynthesis protein CobW [Pseudomonas aeruginosa]